MTTPKIRRTYAIPRLLQNRRRSRQARAQSFLSAARNSALALATLASCVVMSAIILLALLYASLTRDLPPVETIPALLDPQSGILFQPTRFYDRNGQLIYTLENAGASRRYLSIDPSQPDHFSPRLTQVTLALVEPGFWSSPGFSLGQIRQAQPLTVAERLASNLLLEDEPDGLRKALRMRLLAAQLVAQYGRAQVLEWYLNSAYFGHMAYGASQAASLYLDKNASNLNLAEAALLGSLLTTPSLNPLDAPQAALERTAETLDLLGNTGLFAREDIDEARSTTLTLAQAPPSTQGPDAFIQYALRQAGSLVNTARLERGGLKVITTLDSKLQEQLLCTLQTQLNRFENPQERGFSVPEDCPAAYLLPTRVHDLSLDAAAPGSYALLGDALLLDPRSAEILAWSGTRNPGGEPATAPQYRTGSLFTPFVAATAFARGFSPASLVWDVPAAMPAGDETAPPIAETYHGPVHLRVALANDYLTPLAALAEQVGSDNVWLLARTLGLAELDRDRTGDYLMDGQAPANILEVAQAYSTFANSGVQVGISAGDEALQPVAVLRIEDLYGRVVFTQEDVASRVLLSPGLAYLVHDVLSDVVARRASLGPANPLEIGRTAGAKNGEVPGGSQAWTAGYTPQVLSVVWMGYANNETDTGSLSAAHTAGVWHALMQYTLRDLPVEEWQQPPEVIKRTVCSPSGQIPTEDCPATVNELFLMGSEPVVADTLYRSFEINRETGLLATIFTPLENIDEKTFMIPPPEYQDWALANGYPLPPAGYDRIQEQPPPPGVEITTPAPFSYVRGTADIRGTAGGDDFVAYRIQVGQGLNPQAWVQLGGEVEQPVLRSALGEWDTRGLDGLYVIRLTVLRAQNRLESHVIQVSVDNTSPSASISYPAPGQIFEYRPGEEILFLGDANDAMGIARLAWYLDDKPLGEQVQEPFYYTWPMTRGEHTLEIQAFDPAGNSTRSQAVMFTVE